jgi:hypothetical protein
MLRRSGYSLLDGKSTMIFASGMRRTGHSSSSSQIAFMAEAPSKIAAASSKVGGDEAILPLASTAPGAICILARRCDPPALEAVGKGHSALPILAYEAENDASEN